MLQPGTSATVAETAAEEQTAERIGSGDVPVYATPMLLALAERAAVAAIKTALEPGMTSVGTRVELDHLAPTPAGSRVEATATLKEVDGRRLVFSFEARDPGGVVARGTHVRVLVRRGPFVEGARSRVV
ncbi:MAG TPA: hotdog domain-containing protein [Actinomycetota bacterium]